MKNFCFFFNYSEPPPIVDDDRLELIVCPITVDENICGCANACCCDELLNNPATGGCMSVCPTAPLTNVIDLDGEALTNADFMLSFKSSNALF